MKYNIGDRVEVAISFSAFSGAVGIITRIDQEYYYIDLDPEVSQTYKGWKDLCFKEYELILVNENFTKPELEITISFDSDAINKITEAIQRRLKG